MRFWTAVSGVCSGANPCSGRIVGDSEPGEILSRIRTGSEMPVMSQLTFVRCSGMRTRRLYRYATAVSSEVRAGSKFAGF